MKTLNLNSTT